MRASWFVGVFGLGVVGGCFSAPGADVLFSCDPPDRPQCPSGYTCEADACCHRDGSDVDASFGECNPAATTETDNPGSGPSTTAQTDSDPTQGSGSDSSTSSGSGPTQGGSSAETVGDDSTNSSGSSSEASTGASGT